MADELKTTIRDAELFDVPGILDIYATYVAQSLTTFEEVPPTLDEMSNRRSNVLAAGLPYLVAIQGSSVVGFAYATSYRARSAYRFTAENSVYVSERLQGRGIGKMLLSSVIARCEAGAWRQLVAIIGGSENAGSIALHSSLGFEVVGTLRAVGYKLNRWADTVVMQRPLGPGGSQHPVRLTGRD